MTTLNALVQRNDFADVWKKIVEINPDESNLHDHYESVWEKIRFMQPDYTEHDMIIVLTKIVDEDDEDEEEEEEEDEWVDVCGLKSLTKEECEADPDMLELFQPESIENGFAVPYSLAYRKWDKWLGYPICDQSLAEFSETEIIAYCLGEMTTISFDEEKIQEFIKGVEKTAEQAIDSIQNADVEVIDDITDEIDEMFRELDEED